jgi:hypothetical protein
VVPVMHLITSWRLQASPLTTTMEHRGGCDHDDGASWWLCRPGTGPGLVAGDAEAAGEASEACGYRRAARQAVRPPGRPSARPAVRQAG